MEGHFHGGHIWDRKVIPGWTTLVEPFKEEARFWYQVWVSGGKPIGNELHNNMKVSRNNFKMAKKKCINATEILKREKFTEACLNGDKDMFEELKKMRYL